MGSLYPTLKAFLQADPRDYEKMRQISAIQLPDNKRKREDEDNASKKK